MRRAVVGDIEDCFRVLWFFREVSDLFVVMRCRAEGGFQQHFVRVSPLKLIRMVLRDLIYISEVTDWQSSIMSIKIKPFASQKTVGIATLVNEFYLALLRTRNSWIPTTNCDFINSTNSWVLLRDSFCATLSSITARCLARGHHTVPFWRRPAHAREIVLFCGGNVSSRTFKINHRKDFRKFLLISTEVWKFCKPFWQISYFAWMNSQLCLGHTFV